MKKCVEFLSVFLLGAFGYGGLELLWRGRTHWTMLLLGGICFLLIYLIDTRMYGRCWQKWLDSAAVITTLEFLCGCLVNLRLGWAVWDYSAEPGNLLGQICPLFFLLWLLLSIPCSWIAEGVFFLFHRKRQNTRKHSLV